MLFEDNGQSDPASFFSDLRMIGDSPVMACLKQAARDAAQRESTIIIFGEIGTGKESLARYVHQNSARLRKPFIPVDCSTLAGTLLEKELFGCSKGAFPGALRDSLGCIRSADGGTLFLDEVDELTQSLQSRIIAAMEQKSVLPMGGEPKPVNFRLIGATNQPVESFIGSGSSEQHPFFRLDVVVLKLPAVREREGGILPLAEHFLKVQADLYREPHRRISREAAQALQAYSWPGNVREIALAMEQAHVLATDKEITCDDLPPRLLAGH